MEKLTQTKKSNRKYFFSEELNIKRNENNYEQNNYEQIIIKNMTEISNGKDYFTSI